MKKTNVVVLSILAVAVILLYVLHFTDNFTKIGTEEQDDQAYPILSGPSRIAYVNIDTLLANYDYFLELRDELLASQEKSGTDLQSRYRNWERQAAKLEDDRQKLLITRMTYEEGSQRLLQEREKLLQEQEAVSARLMDEEQVMNRKVLFSILDYLKEFNSDGRYQYILSNTLGGNILYASDSLNLTEKVITGLNQKYLAGKKK